MEISMARMLNGKTAIPFLILSLFALTGCLTPEERAEIYGGRFAQGEAEQTSNSPISAAPAANPNQPAGVAQPVDSSGIVYQPPQAAPTIPVVRRPIAGLRPAEPVAPVTRPSVPVRPQPARAGGNTCGANELSHLKGQPLASLNSMRFKQPIRIIMPGQLTTKDYIAQRLNMDITEQGVIGRLWCG
jgi:hypothetical protein